MRKKNQINKKRKSFQTNPSKTLKSSSEFYGEKKKKLHNIILFCFLLEFLDKEKKLISFSIICLC